MGKPPSTKVMEIFSEAAASDAARRGQILDRACQGDPELRAEVESLLTTQQRTGGFLAAPTVEEDQAAAAEGDGPGHEPDSLERDQVLIGRYNIIERIGEGGFGVVYHARQDHPISRDVALKIVKLGMDTRQIIARFESERQALARMDHPNIARIFDAGATPEGRPYFVMELVRGSPLTDYCDTQRLTIPQRLDLFMSVCHAVQHAHQKGIIHRDLKPSNILVVKIDGAPVPKVIDFGIAKAMEARVGDQTTCAEVRHFVGTPQYMSPEQAGAGTGDIDTRSDIYSLGVLLYELLTSATPFDAQTLRDASFEQVQRIIREKEPPKPSTRLTSMGPPLADVAERRGLDRQKLCRTVAGELDWIVMKALEKDRRQRYETASALAEDVRRYSAHEPVLAGPPDTLYRVRKFTRRHRKPLLVAAVVTLALLLGLAGTTFGLIRAKRDRDRAQAALAQAEQISSFLADMLRSADPDRAKGSQVLVRDVVERTSRSIDQGALKDQPLVEAGIRMALGGSYHSLGLFPDAEAQFRKALDIRMRLLGADNPETARTMIALASALGNRANFDEAESLTRRALAAQEHSLGAEHPDMVVSLMSLGMLHRSRQDWAGAEAIHRRALAMARRVAPGRDLTAGVLTDLGVTLLDEKNYDGAEPLFQEAIAINRKLHGDLFRNVPRNFGNLALVRRARGDLKGAEEYWGEALRIERQMLPPDHPDIAWNLRLLGQVKRQQGDFPAAERYFRESLEMERKIFGGQHPIVADILEDLAGTLRDEGHGDEANSFTRQSMEIRLSREAATLAAHPDEASRHSDIADLYLRLSRFGKALEHLNRAAALNPSNHWYWFELACLRCYLGDDSGYREACRQLLDRFADSRRTDIAERTAKACLLTTDPVGEIDRLNRLADRAVASGGPYVAWFQMCKGLVEYRSGHYAAARDWFSKAANVDSLWGTPTVKLLSAMTEFRLGNTAAAHAGYRAVLEDVKTLPAPGGSDLGSSPENFLIFGIFQREAKGMFGEVAPTTHPSP
jgi:serine/threonine protein kinase/tetratricopeptide (TPR) repeat protein